MDFIFEIVFDIIIEGCFEASSNRKIPKVIRIYMVVYL